MSARQSLSSGERKLRYRELLTHVADIEEECDARADTVERVAAVLGESDRLLAEGDEEEHARHPGEGFLDSQLLRATSDIVIRCSEAVSGNVNSYDSDALAQHMRQNTEFWEFSLPRTVPVAAHLHGAFEPTPPQERPRAPRRRVERQQLAALKKPDTVSRLEKTEEGAEMISRVHKFVARRYREGGGAPLSYFHLVLDPGSFARTIENVYYVSFLARDGLLAVEIDESVGLPYVSPVAAAQHEADERSSLDEKQFIVSMDMRRWREYVKAFRIERPMMVLKRG